MIQKLSPTKYLFANDSFAWVVTALSLAKGYEIKTYDLEEYGYLDLSIDSLPFIDSLEGTAKSINEYLDMNSDIVTSILLKAKSIAEKVEVVDMPSLISKEQYMLAWTEYQENLEKCKESYFMNLAIPPGSGKGTGHSLHKKS